MCRIYRPSGSESYIRLCAYFGGRRGDRIPATGYEWNASGHVRKLRMPLSFLPPKPVRSRKEP